MKKEYDDYKKMKKIREVAAVRGGEKTKYWFNTDKIVSDLFYFEYEKLCKKVSLDQKNYLTKSGWVCKPDLVKLVKDAIKDPDNKEKYISILKLFLQDGAEDVCVVGQSQMNACSVICMSLDKDLMKAYLDVVKEPQVIYYGMKTSPLFVFMEKLDEDMYVKIKECYELMSEESLSKQFDALPEDVKKHAGNALTVLPGSAKMFISLVEAKIAKMSANVLDEEPEMLLNEDEVLPLGDGHVPDGE